MLYFRVGKYAPPPLTFWVTWQSYIFFFASPELSSSIVPSGGCARASVENQQYHIYVYGLEGRYISQAGLATEDEPLLMRGEHVSLWVLGCT